MSRGKGAEPAFYAVCNDRRTLLTLVNLGSIDLHPWLSHRGSLESPDWAILDLDPKEAPFSDVVKIARALGRLLRGIGIEPSLKTSGSTGLHVCIPLKPGYTYDQSRMFCETVARVVVREHPTSPRWTGGESTRRESLRRFPAEPPRADRGAALRDPARRGGIRLDAPRLDELEGDLKISDFTLLTAPARVEKIGDLFRTALRQPQDLTKAIRALSRQL